MKPTLLSAIALIALSQPAGSALAGEPVRNAEAQASTPAQRAAIKRGEYLVMIMACHDCHTPKKMGPQGPEPDFSRSLSGHPEGEMPPPPKLGDGPWMATVSWDLTAWSGPWGISYPINLTPDEDTGIGIWTEEMFLQTIRTGRHMGVARPILPPMPWQVYAKATDQDLKAVFAYLKSLPPIKNRVPEPFIIEPPEAPPAGKK